ncbi:hypothetical protein CLU85_2124 [Acidovorax sp. 69]|nr:hypothetical protein CLU85_2124 [Acidovorax sp. 69]
MDIPLSGCVASPFFRADARCGKEDAAIAAGRPLLGGNWLGPRQLHRPVGLANSLEIEAL